jgi:sulfur-oxidizing protein SoxY
MRTRPGLSRRGALIAAIGLAAAGRRAWAQAAGEDDPWPSLAAQIFKDRKLEDGGGILSLDAPYRAEDAAVVPISVRNLLPPGQEDQVRAITLVIDQNPSPLAATFTLGKDSGIRILSTRIRVDSYTKIHAVAEMADGNLKVVERFEKAAGGCSAPAAKQEADSIPLGTMRFRQFPPAAGTGRREAELMIRHPNYSGMQMDQLTRLYVPAHFVSSVHVWQGNDLLLAIESGISISENPAFRFDYRPNGAAAFRVDVKDSKGEAFNRTWPALPA